MDQTSRSSIILVVDDSPLIRTALTELFESMGLAVDTVPSGEAAIDAYRSQQYDVIFLDCRMPGISGPETAKQIRALEDGNHTPIVGMSAHDQDTMSGACIEAGMDDFLDKLSDIEVFEGTLLRWSPASHAAV